ncbi:MAG: putative transport system permease protein, partial [Acidimicrobiaceae bacterium]|nr:putative transport system permease protein [Acidimicrobiaceae bacterium]
SATGTIRSYAQVVDGKGVPVGGSSSPTFGSEWIDDARVNPFSIETGHAPTADTEMVVDRNTYSVGHFHVGDNVEVLFASGEPQHFTITGTTRFGTADSPAGTSYVHFTPTTAERVFATNGSVDEIMAVAAPGTTQDELKARVAAALSGQKVDVFSGPEATAKRQSDIQKNLKGFTTFLLVFGVVALFVGSFVIFNTFRILVAQRRRELALLRAIGATRKQVRRSVLIESLVIGLVAAAIGVVGGFVLAAGLRALFGVLGFRLPAGGLVLKPRTIVVGILSGSVVTVVAGLLPAWEASRVAPIAALQSAANERRRRSSVRLALGLVVLAGSIALLLWGLNSTGDVSIYRTGGAGGIAILAFALLGPTLIVPFAHTVGFALRHRGTTGVLAEENVVRSPRRNSLTALSLTVGLALVVLIMVFSASFSAQITKAIDGQFKGDFFVTSSVRIAPLSTEVANRVAAVPDVAALTPIRFASATYIDATGKKTDAFLLAVNTKTVLETVDVPVLAGSITDVTTDTVALGNRDADQLHVGVGESVAISFRGEPQQLRVAAIINSDKVIGLFQGASALVDLSTYDQHYANPADSAVYVRLKDRTDIAGAKARIEAAVAPFRTARVSDLASYKKLVEEQLRPFLLFIFVLLGISVVIAVIGVANTLKLSVAERTRELGLLRAVGMNRGQSRAMVRWESIVISVFGALGGIIIGTGFGLALMVALRNQGFTEIAVPIGQLVFVTVGAAVLGLIAAWGAARRVSRLDILTAIAIE